MAFDFTNYSEIVDNVGVEHSLKMHVGVVPLVGGTATVTMPRGGRVVAAFASSQSGNAARVSATLNNTITITGTGTDVVMWLVFAK